MKILVTGGTGLVGFGLQQINEYYDDEFIFIGSKDCDLTQLSETREIFNKYQPDYVIHLAAYVGGLFKNMNFKVDMYEKNTLINCNILRCCHEHDVKKVVSCLSTCIFPDDTTYPINETMTITDHLTFQMTPMPIQNVCWKCTAKPTKNNMERILYVLFLPIFMEKTIITV